MTDSMHRIGVDQYQPTREAPAGRKGDPVAARPDVPQPRIGLDQGMDPDYVEFFVGVIPQAVAVARRITGDLASAEDAASEALAKAYLRWPKLQRLGYRRAWVLRVVTNEAIGMVRREARRDGILRRQPLQPTVANDPAEAQSLVVGHIRRLPRRQREVVTLRFYAELTTAEVAAALGITAGSVKSHLHRALDTLRERLGTDILGGTLE